MRTLNTNGLTSRLVPAGDAGSGGDFIGEVILFTGDVPTSDALQSVVNKMELVSAYEANMLQVPSMTFRFSYDETTSTRIIRKTPVDAIDFVPTIDGDLTWFAIIFAGGKILFSDSIGDWDNSNNYMIMQNKTLVNGETNYVKDISFVLSERPSV